MHEQIRLCTKLCQDVPLQCNAAAVTFSALYVHIQQNVTTDTGTV